FFGETQQLRRMQCQLTADHLFGDLLHQLQQLLATGLFEVLAETLETLYQLVQRLRRLVERFQALEAAFLAADGLAVLDATLEAFAMAGFASLLQALFVTPVDAFLEALGDSALQRRRIAGQDVVALRHGPDPRRKTERAPGAAFALD